ANFGLGLVFVLMLTLQTVLLIRASRDPTNPIRLARMLLDEQNRESAARMCGIMLFEACVFVFVLCGIKGQMTPTWFNGALFLAVAMILGLKYLDIRRIMLGAAGVALPPDPVPSPAPGTVK